MWLSRDVPAASWVHACHVVDQHEINRNETFSGADRCGVSVFHFL
jgi:hypothetical protein